MSTMEPPPRPTSVEAPTRRTWTRIEPCMSPRELAVWRGIAGAIGSLLVLGVLLGVPFAATWAFLLLVPALLMADNRAPWWVRR